MFPLEFLFPRRCLACGQLGAYFCPKCRGKIQLAVNICPVCGKAALSGMTHFSCQSAQSLDGLTSFFVYQGMIKKGIQFLKYRLISHLAEELTALIPESLLLPLREQFSSAFLVPIPLHSSRQRFRGFNQTEVLGKILARRLKIPEKSLLQRVKKTAPQVEMKGKKERWKNLKGAFSLGRSFFSGRNFSSSSSLKLPPILLFDDVFTTGATLSAACRVLKKAGFPKVWGLTLAHG